ncbi:flagellar hook-basal body complex protein FliE [Candidatus Dependentiae bacterium]|nr:flagellar hook-basal body complex protein FliE [Candidatus Dependentiae bacterium]
MIDLQPNFEQLIKTTPVNNSKISSIPGKSEGLQLVDSFASILKSQLVDTNDAQIYADEMNKKLVLGEVSNVHDVMIAGQKATMALEFTLQLRNLLMNAYNQLTMLR